MRHSWRHVVGAALLSTLLGAPVGVTALADASAKTRTVEVRFRSHDGHDILGLLTLPETRGPAAVVIYVQTAEGATVHMKRRKSRDATFNYYDLYRDKLPEMNVAFFSYEGRGVRMGDKPPRFEEIDRAVYDTSTLDNKVRDVLSAVQAVRRQPGAHRARILLMGASEGTLLAAEAASRAPRQIAGLILYGVLASNLRDSFRYIMSDGAFLTYRTNFDTDKDGMISKAEFEADPRKYRANVLRGAPFTAIDRNTDGSFTVEDMCVLTKTYLDAIDTDDYGVLQAWATTSAAVSVPKDWFKDHFAHRTIWEFLRKLTIPVGCFHGELDTNTPIAAVRRLEEDAKKAGRRNIEFHYFADLDHSLGVIGYFLSGEVPAGHAAIFAFVRDQLGAP